MNGTNNSGGGRFEDRLLVELKQVVASRASSAEPTQAPPVRRAAWRPRLALAGGAATLGLAGAFLLPTFLGNENAAFAVTENDDGTVTVKINHFSDAEELRRKLADVDIPATVEYLPLGQMCAEPWFTGDSSVGQRLAEPARDGSITFTLDPDEFTGDKSLVVQTSGPNSGIETGTEIMVAIASGPVRACNPVDAGHGSERIEQPPRDAGPGHETQPR